MTDDHPKKRILFIIDGLEFGGGERLFTQLINALPTEAYQVFITSFPNKTLQKAIHGSASKFIALDFSKKLKFSIIIKLIKIIRENEIDIVVGQGARAEFYARLAKRVAGGSKYISIIQMPVEKFNIGLFRKRVYSLIDKFTESYVNRFVVVSAALKDQLIRQHGVAPEKIIKIYNGVEVNHYSPGKDNGYRARLMAEYGVKNEAFLIGAIGRMVWQKGFEYLIKALPDIAKNPIPAKLIIIGEGPLRKELEILAEKLKVKDSVIFGGFRSDIIEILSAIDLLVVPSLLEGFPMIILEAMAMAKPIIATDLPGILEQIEHKKTGIIVPPKDSIALSQRIIEMIEDVRKATRLGQNARDYVINNFTIDKLITDTEKVYKELVQE